VIGMRRSGKTWFLFQSISDLLATGVPKEFVLYLNLEDERLLPLKTSDLHVIPDTYFRLYPHARDSKSYFFLDEIQNVTGWERFLRRLLDTENIHICITGSSARLLSTEIATSLRGRSITTEIFPFSFFEYLSHHGVEVDLEKRPNSKKRSVIENKLRHYLIEGGFPEIQGLKAEYRIRILQDYLNVVILRDLIERYGVSNTVALRYLIRHLMNAPASLFSINKFFNDLKSQGVSCGKNSLHEFMDYLADSYLFFQLFIHTTSERARMVNPRKVYVIDTGMINACSRNPRPQWGHLLENFVFTELRRKYRNIEYYKTSSGREVDFVVTDIDGNRSLIQVAADITDLSTLKREQTALEEAMGELNISKSYVITLDRENIIKTTSGSIYILPAWLWAIRLESSKANRFSL
ncbi:MAG TPA: ATP-binding protein, partial [Deltaproteobacteria bacterium]|nr:ATP-binding protein [Deltaproteobacteria bacterium]